MTAGARHEVFQTGNARSESTSLLRMSPVSNPFLFVATLSAVALHVAALYLPPTQYVLRVEPIDLGAWLRIVPVAATVLAAVELHKWAGRRSRTMPSFASASPVHTRCTVRP